MLHWTSCRLYTVQQSFFKSTGSMLRSWKWLLLVCERLKTTSVSSLLSLALCVFALEPAELQTLWSAVVRDQGPKTPEAQASVFFQWIDSIEPVCWFKPCSVCSAPSYSKKEGADMVSWVYSCRWEERCGVTMSPLIEWEADAWLYWWVILLLWWEVGGTEQFIGLSIWVWMFLWEPSGIYLPHTARSEGEHIRRELTEYFSRFQSLFSGLNYNIWNSLNAETPRPLPL